MPTRVNLAHTPPDFVETGAQFFLTLCAARRGTNSFATDATWDVLRHTAEHYHRIHRWYARVVLAMPDHVHLIASFPATEEMRRVVAAWKHYTAHQTTIQWQRDFFDHRLRSHENVEAQISYIRMNPVRAGLVTSPELWPYTWRPDNLVATPV